MLILLLIFNTFYQMKKLFLVAAVAVSMVLSSCGGDNGVKCWEMSYKWLGQKVVYGYYYGDGTDADAELAVMESFVGFGTWSKKATKKSEQDCDAASKAL